MSERILFWSDDKKPSTYAGSLIPADKKAQAIEVLGAGRQIAAYRGMAQCRICGEWLGSCDLTGHGFMWPEKAEHYIEAHNVWLPEIDALLEAKKAATTHSP